MNRYGKLLLRTSWAFVAFAAHCAEAQEMRDTLSGIEKHASQIDVSAPVRHTAFGGKRLSADSASMAAYRNQSMAALLGQQFPVFVRTYGTNGLATLSLRGASAAQTTVRWNRVPLQNGATGLVDLMLLPVVLFDNAAIEYANDGGMTGNGAIGGTLSLQNDYPVFRKNSSYSLSSGGGSFGNVFASGKAKKSTERWTGSITAAAHQAANNFGYTDNVGERVAMNNAKVTSGTVQLSYAYKFSPKTFVQVSVWADKHSREIPPALFESYSVKEQKDAAIRSNIVLTHATDSQGYRIQASVIDEWFRYSDTAAAIRADVHTRQYYAEPGIFKTFRNRSLEAGISLPQQWNGIVGIQQKRIIKSGATGMLRKWWSRAVIYANAHGESFNGKIIGSGGANANLEPTRYISLRAGGGYAYRTPTLNELYYTPGGNENLLPEQGWSSEAGYTVKTGKGNKLATSHSTTAFYRNINNWILWFGGAIWTPHNIARVVSQGIETENKLTWTRPKIRWTLTASGSYISSQTKESKVAGDGSIGKQIPYAPRWIGQGSIGFTTPHWRLNYNQIYTGLRYYNTDETGALEAFALSNIQCGYLWTRRRWGLDVNAQVNNLLNRRYIEVSGRPAPGTNWLLGITISEQYNAGKGR